MSWQNVDEFNTRQEIVKCVVVGDTAVGKTRLICAKACNAFLTLPQMLTTHIPTVWAIDQYRIHKEVLQRSWMLVDGVNVSLRLWDTFGDHEKDRKFAYGRSDVVLLCFSISSPQSFKHCKTKWVPEIRQYCPHVPIVLVGCKNDLRHIYRDDAFLELCKERNPFIRIMQESDLITREQGRQLATDIGAVYYESSVYTPYGVDTVFENAMRLALIARRQKRFWVKNLKNVTSPILQIPYCPPKPKQSEIQILPSTFREDLCSLLDKEYHSDVTLIAGHKEFHAHRIILAAASSYLKELFISSAQEKNLKVTLSKFARLTRSSIRSFLRFLYSGNLDIKMVDVLEDFKEAAEATDIDELQVLIQNIEKPDFSEFNIREQYYEKFLSNLSKVCLEEKLFIDVTFNVDDGKCYAHRAILMARCDVMTAMFGGDFLESTADIISFPGVSKEVFEICLHYLYTDSVDERVTLRNCLSLIELANRLCLPRLINMVECHIIQELMSLSAKGVNLNEDVFRLMEPCQVHYADQLSDSCQYYIITHYQDISINSPKLLKKLHLDNQAYLNKNRWPPLHFLKEQEFYERCVHEQESKEKPQKYLLWKTAKKTVSRCLCIETQITVQDNNHSDPPYL